MEEPGGPGDTHGADSWVFGQTLVRVREFLQLDQSDVVLPGGDVVPLFQTCEVRFLSFYPNYRVTMYFLDKETE